jgi:translation initiation factor 1
MRPPASGGLVYSTEQGRMCPACRQSITACACGAASVPTPGRAGDAVARVSLDSKARGGKMVTVVRGLRLDAVALAELGKRLRTQCATGGTVKDATLELQGDHCERVISLLEQSGWQVKRAGG